MGHYTNSGRLIVLSWLAATAAFAAACGYVVRLTPSIDPSAVVVRLPLAVGVHYPPEFRAYEFKYAIREEFPTARGYLEKVLTFPVGEASLTLFDRVFQALFESAHPVPSLPPLSAGSPDVVAVIESRIKSAQLHVMWDPVRFKQQPVMSSIIYEFTLYSPQGTTIASWTINGFGEKGWSFFPFFGEAPRREVVELAMQDAARKFIHDFQGIPEVQQLLKATTGAGGRM